jgi:hypothetical protein
MRMLLALSASVAMAACATSSATPTTGASVTPAPPGTVSATTPAGASWRASLQSMNGTSISGSATVTPAPGGSTANINIRDAVAGAVHPWHVHVGTCATGGGIAGPASAYSPLNVTSGGNANSSAQLPMTLDPTQSYHVNVHNSPSDMGTIVACGDLHAVRG